MDAKIRSLALGKSRALDNRIKDAVVGVLDESLNFVEAQRPVAKASNSGKHKYIYLKGPNHEPKVKIRKTDSGQMPLFSNLDLRLPQPQNSATLDKDSPQDQSIELFPKKVNDGIPEPKFPIYEKSISLEWRTDELPNSVGLGLHNMGNTCFLNSVLQVLTHTPAMVNYLLNDHKLCQPRTGVCALCELRDHVRAALKDKRNSPFPEPIIPARIIQRIRHFMKSHQRGRQEDAHEFLRYFIDAMQNASLINYSGQKLDMFTKGTTVVGRIFGGYHRNEITCMSCNAKSTTYDPFLDLSLEVKRLGTIEEALKQFTKLEMLSAENAYKCLSCKKSVRAKKMYTIHRAPNILTIQLKRFDHYGKVGQYIKFQERLDLRPFMSEKNGPRVLYRLYGTIIHQGNSTHSGHYYAFVRSPTGQWHIMDDSRICPVNQKNVLAQPAYLLFYARQHTQTAAVRPVVSTAVSPLTEDPPGLNSAPKKIQPFSIPSQHLVNRDLSKPLKPLHKVSPLNNKNTNTPLKNHLSMLVRPKPPSAAPVSAPLETQKQGDIKDPTTFSSDNGKSLATSMEKKPEKKSLVPYEDDDEDSGGGSAASSPPSDPDCRFPPSTPLPLEPAKKSSKPSTPTIVPSILSSGPAPGRSMSASPIHKELRVKTDGEPAITNRLKKLKRQTDRSSSLSPSQLEARKKKKAKLSPLSSREISPPDKASENASQIPSESSERSQISPESTSSQLSVLSNIDFGDDESFQKSVVAETEGKIKMKFNLQKGTVETLTVTAKEEVGPPPSPLRHPETVKAETKKEEGEERRKKKASTEAVAITFPMKDEVGASDEVFEPCESTTIKPKKRKKKSKKHRRESSEDTVEPTQKDDHETEQHKSKHKKKKEKKEKNRDKKSKKHKKKAEESSSTRHHKHHHSDEEERGGSDENRRKKRKRDRSPHRNDEQVSRSRSSSLGDAHGRRHRSSRDASPDNRTHREDRDYNHSPERKRKRHSEVSHRHTKESHRSVESTPTQEVHPDDPFSTHKSRPTSHIDSSEKERKRRIDYVEDKRDSPSNSDASKYFSSLSSSGYGPSVKSWTGEKSRLNEEADREKREREFEERKATLEDAGPNKKLKNKDHEKRFSWGPLNMFQKMQNNKNRQVKRRRMSLDPDIVHKLDDGVHKILETKKFTPFFTKRFPFSNHYPSLFRLDGKKFTCTEQYYMYHKALRFQDKDSAKEILNSRQPRDMKRIGSQVRGFNQQEWDKVSIEVMTKANEAKYAQNPQLLQALFRTQGTVLVEANPTDYRWGVGLPIHSPDIQDYETWRGDNRLGFILTTIRENMWKDPQYAKERAAMGPARRRLSVGDIPLPPN